MNKKVKVDPLQVVELAKVGCTVEEMAAILRCSKDTLNVRFATEIAQGRSDMKERLRRAQLKLALAGNATMLIWLGKCILKQSEQVQPEATDADDEPGRQELLDELKKV